MYTSLVYEHEARGYRAGVMVFHVFVADQR